VRFFLGHVFLQQPWLCKYIVASSALIIAAYILEAEVTHLVFIYFFERF